MAPLHAFLGAGDRTIKRGLTPSRLKALLSDGPLAGPARRFPSAKKAKGKSVGLDASTFNRSEALKAELAKKAAIEKYAVAKVEELPLEAPAMGCASYADNDVAHNLDLYPICWSCLDCFAKRLPGPVAVAHHRGGK
jgi:hypothetical protein